MTDALRLAFGTLTALRVPAPRVVDRRTGGVAMALAPLVGLVLGGLGALAGFGADALGLDPLVCATVCVGALALLTRGLHLDGLADTADGLGSGRRGVEALGVMTRSDIGPFGVVTLVFVLLLQVAALAQAWSVGHGAAALIAAAVISRTALPLLCRRSVPAAKATGLGAVVASTVGPLVLVTSIGAATAAVIAIGYAAGGGSGLVRAAIATFAGLGAALLLGSHCVRRFTGITGDVLGAGVETALAAALLVLAAAAT